MNEPIPASQGGFGRLAGVLLLAVAAARLLTNQATTRLATPHDPLLSLSLRQVFWLAGGVELAVAGVCLLGRWPRLKAIAVLWLALNQLVYLAGLGWGAGCPAPVVHVVSLGETFGLAPAVALGILLSTYFCLLASSGQAALRLWAGRERAAEVD